MALKEGDIVQFAESAFVVGAEPASIDPPDPGFDVCVTSPNWGTSATPYLVSASSFWGSSASEAQRLSVLLVEFLVT